MIPYGLFTGPTDVVNGEKNQLSIAVENKTPRVVTVVSVAGSVHHPETDKLIKNVSGPVAFAVVRDVDFGTVAYECQIRRPSPARPENKPSL